jgi:hypothetical protein
MWTGFGLEISSIFISGDSEFVIVDCGRIRFARDF